MELINANTKEPLTRKEKVQLLASGSAFLAALITGVVHFINFIVIG